VHLFRHLYALAEVREFGDQGDVLLICFVLQNTRDCSNSISDVERFDAGPEFARLYLRIVQKVLNQKGHKLGG